MVSIAPIPTDESIEHNGTTCPICGGPMPKLEGLQIIDGIVFWNGRRIPFTPLENRLFIYLWNRRGRYQSTERIMEYLYGDDPNGGPLTNALGVRMSQIRTKIREHKVKVHVETAYKYGWRIVMDGK